MPGVLPWEAIQGPVGVDILPAGRKAAMKAQAIDCHGGRIPPCLERTINRSQLPESQYPPWPRPRPFPVERFGWRYLKPAGKALQQEARSLIARRGTGQQTGLRCGAGKPQPRSLKPRHLTGGGVYSAAMLMSPRTAFNASVRFS